MADTKQAGVPMWIKLGVVAALVLGVWALIAARGAGADAKANAEQLARPDLEIIAVPGGPQRFSEAFEAAIEDLDDDQSVDPATHRWITVVLDNEGIADVDGVEVTLEVGDVGTPTYLADLPGFRDLDVETDGNVVTLDVGSIDVEESARVFVGVPTDALPESVADTWSQTYREYVAHAGVLVRGSDGVIAEWYGGLF